MLLVCALMSVRVCVTAAGYFDAPAAGLVPLMRDDMSSVPMPVITIVFCTIEK